LGYNARDELRFAAHRDSSSVVRCKCLSNVISRDHRSATTFFCASLSLFYLALLTFLPPSAFPSLRILFAANSWPMRVRGNRKSWIVDGVDSSASCWGSPLKGYLIYAVSRYREGVGSFSRLIITDFVHVRFGISGCDKHWTMSLCGYSCYKCSRLSWDKFETRFRHWNFLMKKKKGGRRWNIVDVF